MQCMIQSNASSAEPLVTIAIPTFNRASWLKGCVESALSQTYENIEVLVSDNGSTDGTPDLLKRLSHPKLRVVRQQTNIGLIANWNACLAEAKGDYILILSDDDRIETEALQRCIQLTRIDPQLSIVVALCDQRDGNGHKVWDAAVSRKLHTGIWQGSDILTEYLQWRISTKMCTILLRTNEVRACGGFPPDLPHVADMAVVARLLFKGSSGLINECCGSYGIHNSRETSRLTVDLLLNDTRKLVDMIIETAKESIKDRRKARQTQLCARRYFSMCAADYLLEYCSGGATFREISSALWRWRAALVPAILVYLQREAKRFAVDLLPDPVINFARQLSTR
jgi:glycosyltransferase involved in cell wall biosynthesis